MLVERRKKESAEIPTSSLADIVFKTVIVTSPVAGFVTTPAALLNAVGFVALLATRTVEFVMLVGINVFEGNVTVIVPLLASSWF